MTDCSNVDVFRTFLMCKTNNSQTGCRGRWKTPSNPEGEWQTVVSEDAVVLHYAYSYLSDVRDKAGKSCPGADYLEAARRGDRAKVLRLLPPLFGCSLACF